MSAKHIYMVEFVILFNPSNVKQKEKQTKTQRKKRKKLHIWIETKKGFQFVCFFVVVHLEYNYILKIYKRLALTIILFL